MWKQGLFVCALLLPGVIWSDETPPAQKGVKSQRVSPKVLREALNLPEYKSQAPQTPPVSLDHVHNLSEKLRANGDGDGADLLQHFIREHRRLVDRSALVPSSGQDAVEIRIETFEVNTAALPEGSHFGKNAAHSGSAADATAARKELSRLVTDKVAKLIDHPVLMTRFQDRVHCSSGEEFPVPIPDGSGKVGLEYRGVGMSYDVLATTKSEDQITLQFAWEVAEKDESNAINLNGHSVPGITKRKVQSVHEIKSGEMCMISGLWTHEHRVLVTFVKATRK